MPDRPAPPAAPWEPGPSAGRGYYRHATARPPVCVVCLSTGCRHLTPALTREDDE